MIKKIKNWWCDFWDWEFAAFLFVVGFILSFGIFGYWTAELLERSRKSSDSISDQIVSINNTNYMLMREGVLYKLLPVKTNSVEKGGTK